MAVSDPMAVEVLDKLRFILNRDIKVAIAPVDAIQTSINRHYGQSETESVDSMLQEFTETAIDFTETEAAEAMVADDDESAPVIRLVNLVMSEAVSMRASDIHVEPFDDRVRIRYRIDGELIERDSPPRRLLGAIVSRIKIMARMDIAEKRRPQDGRIKARIAGREFDMRVSIFPPSTARRSSCGSWIGRTSVSVSATWALVKKSTGPFRTSFAGPTASFWSPARPGAGRRPRSTAHWAN